MILEKQPDIALKQTIENLIKAGTTFDTNELESIYHKDLQVFMTDGNGQLMISDKETFKNLFQSKKENEDPPLNTWAKFVHVKANGNKGHVIVKRKVNLTGQEQTIMLSIDLILEEERWQAIREVIFAY